MPLPALPDHISGAKGVRQGVCPDIGIWQQYSANLGFKWLLIWSLNDSLYIVIILFPEQLIEYTCWGVGGLAMGKN